MDKHYKFSHAVIALVVRAVQEPFEKKRHQLTMLQEPQIIGDASWMENDWEKFVTDLDEIRYTQYCTKDTIMDAATEMLQKFQPLVYRIRDAIRDVKPVEGDQAAIDKMIRTVRGRHRDAPGGVLHYCNFIPIGDLK